MPSARQTCRFAQVSPLEDGHRVIAYDSLPSQRAFSLAGHPGWINRALPDAELAAFVDRFARRIASFEQPAIVAAKTQINKRAGVPSGEDLMDAATAAPHPDTQARHLAQVIGGFHFAEAVDRPARVGDAPRQGFPAGECYRRRVSGSGRC